MSKTIPSLQCKLILLMSAITCMVLVHFDLYDNEAINVLTIFDVGLYRFCMYTPWAGGL